MKQPDCLGALIAQYPGRAEWIERVYELDPTFREICQDRHSIVVSLATLGRRATSIEHDVEELETLLRHLDAEIAPYLDT